METTTTTTYRGYQLVRRRNGVGREYLNIIRDGKRIAHADTIAEAQHLIDTYLSWGDNKS